MDKNLAMMRMQFENNKMTLMAIGGMSIVGVMALIMIAPGLTQANVSTQVISETNTNTVKAATTTPKKSTAAKSSAASKVKRPVYLVSDNISGKTADTKRMQNICAGLKKKGISCQVSGLGPNTHNKIMTDGKTPSNALIVQIYGGKCAGTIWNLGTKWYKKAKGSRKVHLVYLPSNYKLNVAWLPRAYDDNFSGILGLARPDLFLKKAGYTWTESSSETKMINDIYAQAIK